MTIEGELTVRLDWDGRRVRGVDVRSTRPYGAPRALAGRSPADAAAMAPLLFSVCAQAQGVAAAAAAEAALGHEPMARTVAAREAAVLLETIQEYLWRMLIDWPQAMGHATLVEPVATARRLIAPALAALAPAARQIDGLKAARGPAATGSPEAAPGLKATRGYPGAGGHAPDGEVRIAPQLAVALSDIAGKHVFGGAPDAWLALMDENAAGAWAERAHTLPARLLAELIATAPDLGRSDVALMPVPRREALVAAVVPALRYTAGFAEAPRWDGAPVETGALARMHAHPCVAAFRARFGNAVVTRMAARLVELAALLGELSGRHADDQAAPCAHAFGLDGRAGIAAVQTARGLLLHYVSLDDGRVAHYRIVAPTEWNFHPEGALVQGLAGLAADGEAALVRRAQLAVQALDPCVACRVEVAHA